MQWVDRSDIEPEGFECVSDGENSGLEFNPKIWRENDGTFGMYLRIPGPVWEGAIRTGSVEVLLFPTLEACKSYAEEFCSVLANQSKTNKLLHRRAQKYESLAIKWRRRYFGQQNALNNAFKHLQYDHDRLFKIVRGHREDYCCYCNKPKSIWIRICRWIKKSIRI